MCPELLYDVAQYGITHQRLAPPTPAPEHGLVVSDVVILGVVATDDLWLWRRRRDRQRGEA